MALTLQQIQAIFKKTGKIVFLSQVAATQSAALKKGLAGVFAQNAAADAEQYDDLVDAMIPFNGSVVSVVNAINGLPAQAKSAVENYFRKAVAIDLGLTANVAMATVLSTLATQMDGVAAHVAPSGSGGTNATGLAMYFYHNWAFALPQNGAPSIPDSYIDDDIVA